MLDNDISAIPYFCVRFAKGDCYYGKNCKKLHSIPTIKQMTKIPMSYDIFGREKETKNREDMGGTGAYNANCRTIYVGKLNTIKLKLNSNKKETLNELKNRKNRKMCEILARHFCEWGQIEHISYKPNLNIAFIRYYHDVPLNLQNNQLDNEVLNVRWAYEDPDPKAKLRIKKENEQKIRQAREQYHQIKKRKIIEQQQ